MTSKFLWHISHSVMVPVLVAAEIAPPVNRTHDPEFVAILVRTNSDTRTQRNSHGDAGPTPRHSFAVVFLLRTIGDAFMATKENEKHEHQNENENDEKLEEKEECGKCSAKQLEANKALFWQNRRERALNNRALSDEDRNREEDELNAKFSAMDKCERDVLHMLHNLNLEGIALREARMPKAILNSADLREAQFMHTNMQEAHFRKANVSEAIFRNTDFTQTNFVQSVFTGATFSNGIKPIEIEDGSLMNTSKIHEADMRWVQFNGSDMRKASFQDVDLRGSTFEGASFDYADLRFAKYLYRAQLPHGWKEALQKAGLIPDW